VNEGRNRLGPDTYHATTTRLVKQSTSKRGRGHRAVIARNKLSVSETPPYQQVLVGDLFLLHHSAPFFIAEQGFGVSARLATVR
jgi:hypothetical protein